MSQNPKFNFMATGIGSVPFLDIQGTCDYIFEQYPLMPFWPQFAKRSYLEDMSAQYCEGLPLVKIDEKNRSLSIPTFDNIEKELTTFYEHFLAQDTDYFAISRDHAPGLYAMLDRIGQDSRNSIGYDGPYIKGQTVGPVTFAAGIPDMNGKPVLYNTEVLDAMVSGLSIKALWQVEALASTGRQTILFMDEPYLSGFGSAFTSIQRHEIIDILKKMIHYLKEHSSTLVGIHCCGNTDWSMIIETGIDIINFDASEYMDHFLLYKEDVTRFVKNGGIVAWGIVPTSGLTEHESVEGFYSKLSDGLRRMLEWGLQTDTLVRQSIITPSCGMGSMEKNQAGRGLELLSLLAQRCRDSAPI